MDPKLTEVSQLFDRFKAAMMWNDFNTCTKLLSQLKGVVLFICISIFTRSVLALGTIVSAKPLEELGYKGWNGDQNSVTSPYASSVYLGWAMAYLVALIVTGVLPIVSWFATYRFSISSAICVGIFINVIKGEGWRAVDFGEIGSITAVMGPSGAGKSTLLDGLAGRIASGSLKGRVSLDGTDVSPSLIKRTSAYIMQDDRLFPMLTVYETLMFAADFRLGSIPRTEKLRRVDTLIEQLGLGSTQNTYIGDEATRGVSGGERRRVSIGVDIIHGPSLLFLDEPTSGLDSTSAQSVIEKVHDIARSGSTVILTIHQPSSRIQLLLDHLIILARGQLMYQGSPKDVSLHLGRMGRKVPKGENSIEYLINVIQEYDQSDHGVEALADFALTGMKPPVLSEEEISMTSVLPSPMPPHLPCHQGQDPIGKGSSGKRLYLQIGAHKNKDFNNSVRSPWNQSMSWSASQSGIIQTLRFTPSNQRTDNKAHNPMR